jgi:HAD superfamily hydrolase (TIGR01509 family)
MKTISTMIFDIGGVLITPAEKVTPFILSQMFDIPIDIALQKYNLALPTLRTGKMTVERLAREISLNFPPKIEISDFEKVYIDFYKKQALIDNSVNKILEKLNSKYKTVAFSNMNDLHAKYNDHRHLFSNFHKVYLSSVTGLVKPDRDAFEHICRDLDVSPQECFFVDDKRENTEMGILLGMETYLFDSTLKLNGYLTKNGLL